MRSMVEGLLQATPNAVPRLVGRRMFMATEPPVPGQPAQPTQPPPEISPPAPDVDVPAPETTPPSPAAPPSVTPTT